MASIFLSAAVWGVLALAAGGCGNDPPVLTVSYEPDTPLANGTSAATISASVSQDGAPLDRGVIRFASTKDGTSFEVIDPEFPPDSSSSSVEETVVAGSARAKLYSIAAGSASVAVTYRDDEYGITVNQSISVTFKDDVTTVAKAVNARNLSISCPHPSIEGLTWNGLAMDCSVFASDYNGMFVPNTTVTLMTEAGGVPSSVVIEQQSGSSSGGSATFTYDTRCGLPRDVTPEAGEFSVACSFPDRCANRSQIRTCNPRDGIAKLVAVTTGTEAFQDVNANLKRDAGESFTDLGEPYLDYNDNGVHDNGEDFMDANANSQYDGPNGRWDEETAIWTSMDLVWTGAAQLGDGFTAITPTETQVNLPPCSRITYKVTPRDINGNLPTAALSTDYLDVVCNGCTVINVDALSLTRSEYSVQIEDGLHSCPCTVDTCPDPSNYTVRFSLSRSGSAGYDSKSTVEFLGERAGTFARAQ